MTKFCPECGTKQRDDNNHFCSNCGFDFSKIENNIESVSSDDSIVNVPINSGDDSFSKPRTSVTSGGSASKPGTSVTSGGSASKPGTSVTSGVSASKPKSSVSTSSNDPNSTKRTKVINNSTQGTKVNNNSTNRTNKANSSDGFLSNLSFNKCFLAFAVLLVIFLIIGLVTNANQEPYSDNGLTSFMERSSSYDISDILEDSSYDSYYSDDYLQYGGDGESDLR